MAFIHRLKSPLNSFARGSFSGFFISSSFQLHFHLLFICCATCKVLLLWKEHTAMQNIKPIIIDRVHSFSQPFIFIKAL